MRWEDNKRGKKRDKGGKKYFKTSKFNARINIYFISKTKINIINNVKTTSHMRKTANDSSSM